MTTETPFEHMTPEQQAIHLRDAHGIDPNGPGFGDELAEHLDDHRHFKHQHTHD